MMIKVIRQDELPEEFLHSAVLAVHALLPDTVEANEGLLLVGSPIIELGRSVVVTPGLPNPVPIGGVVTINVYLPRTYISEDGEQHCDYLDYPA